MTHIDLPSENSPEIDIKSIAGSLQIKGWDEDSIRIEVRSQDELHYESNEDKLSLSCDSDCILRVPEDCAVHIGSVSGDAYIASIEGEVRADSVGGSLTLKNVGATVVGNVSGNLNVRNVEGELRVADVSGNANIRDIEGDLEVKEVRANLSLRDVEGSVEAKSSGNAELRLEIEDGSDYHIEAGGNLFCYLDEDTDADVSLQSGAERIQVATGDSKQLLQTKKHEFTLGDGGADIELKAGGHIDFRSRAHGGDADFGVDFDSLEEMSDLADEISEQVTAQVEGQLEALNVQLESLGERLRQSGDRAARVAQRRVAAAQRKLQHKLHGPHGRIINVTNPIKSAEPVSDKERMLILQMVQDKKISVQEAEMLLNTLEGRAPAAAETVAPPVSQASEQGSGQGEQSD